MALDLGVLRVQGERVDLDEARALAAGCGVAELLERAVGEARA